MSTRIRTTLAASSTWFGLHVVLACLSIGAAHSVPLLLATLLVAGVLVTQAMRPILPPRWFPAWPGEVPILVVGPTLIEWITLHNIDPDAMTGYANWPVGVSGLVIAGIVARGRLVAAVVAAALIIAVQTITYYHLSPPGAFDERAIAMLSIPPQMWLLVSIAVLTHLGRAENLARSYHGRAAKDALITETERGWRSVRGRRLRELEQTVVPFLERAAAASPAELEHVRREAAALCSVARDSLRARALMDPLLAASVRSARDRGVAIRLTAGDITPALQGAVEGIRSFLFETLALPDLTRVSVHLESEARELVLVLGLAQRSDADIETRLRRLLPGWTLTAVRVDDELLVRGTQSGTPSG